MSKVFFIGAGPGDPDLITIKTGKILATADLVIYAGSLVNTDVLKLAKPGAAIYDSARMELAELIDLMKDYVSHGKTVARVHTGEPSLYGAIAEQMAELDKAGIEYEVVPGVSSAFAAAAALKCELTLPEVSQTVIFTRLSGRTSVPEEESLASLSRHRATMAIFLSVSETEHVVRELLEGYQEDTPAAVVYKASWPEEKIIRGTLSDIADKVKQAKINKTALILVGRALDRRAIERYSKLYDKDFKHGYRN